MCGLVGVYCFDRTRPVDRVVLARQNDAMVHRGPDGGDVYVGPGVGLGHRRLAIIDLGGGAQPMWDFEDELAIVFNGEVYNYRELKAELESLGQRFRTESDTEVILGAYRAWGRACVDRFVGMFVFALYDRDKHTMFLARDRIGKKPLYYYRDDNRIIFASELKAILADPSVPRVLDPTSAVDFFAYGYVPAPTSILRGIQKLPAGHAMCFTPEGVDEYRYWDLDFTHVDETLSLEQSAESLMSTLDDAVNLRLRSDVPLGAFLSGGIDSSLIVALMAKRLSSPVKTHTIGFTEDAFDERRYARETAEGFGTDHTERIVTADAASILERLAWHYDEPFADSSSVPTYYLSQATRETVTVALSGDGGDESFAGYRRYMFAMFESRVRRSIPPFVQRKVLGRLARLYPKADYLPQFLRAKATLTNLADSHEHAYFLSLTQKTYPRAISRDFLGGLRGYDPYHHFDRHFRACASKDALARLQYVDFKMYLAEQILTKVDRASMAHSLEVRVPLLDHRVVELAARMPGHHKLSGSRAKIVLKEVASRLLPPSTINRRKMGFSIPLDAWFKGGLREPTEAVFFDRPGGQSGLLNTRGLRRMWYEHQLGVANHATQLWSLLMFELWAGRFLASDLSSAFAAQVSRPTPVDPVGAPA
ncbi:MAG: asparagine synthase (glutamine-hydrolyzing) [Deltaproteobacteria bacterium]|nr:asparagine synthase (glutamine-hydrolyzing) [Deltaproteobacteria bacterium]